MGDIPRKTDHPHRSLPARRHGQHLWQHGGEALSPGLGQHVVVDFKPGANGGRGASQVAKSPTDGYTLLMAVNSAMTINPSPYAKLPFDPLNDFSPVSMAFTSANLLVVNANSPAKSVKDLVALAKAKPGKLFYGSAGKGSTGHLSGEMFRQLTGAPVAHVGDSAPVGLPRGRLAGCRAACGAGNIDCQDRLHREQLQVRRHR